MKSETLTVQQVFQDRRQYCVPFYQRAYVWTLRNQWTALWEDIHEKALARVQGMAITPHFLGAVVLEPQVKEGLMGVDTLHIIDGQQRLTTLQYILGSLYLALESTGLCEFQPALLGCMQNSNEGTMRNPVVERFKLWPTFRDEQHYVRSLAAQSLDELRKAFPDSFTQHGSLRVHHAHPPSLEALWFFTRTFVKWIRSDNASPQRNAEALIMAVLKDLKLVSICLEAEDDAQVIFETLNGRGAELHATDLIRNYIFMRAEHDGVNAMALYEEQWKGFEDSYWSERQRRGRLSKPRMEWLIHATLQVEMGCEIDLSRLYNEYRRYVATTSPSPKADQQVMALNRYAIHYKALIKASSTSPIGRLAQRIAAYDVTTLHPLALLISVSDNADAEKTAMYDDLVSYVVRRAICGLTPKNYNNVFMNALRHLSKTCISAQELRNNLNALGGEASRWPSDAEFFNACTCGSLFPGRLDAPRMRSLLTELEGALRRTVKCEEPVSPDLSSLDIDHLMPQSWFTHWPLPGGTMVTDTEVTAVDELLLMGAALSPVQVQIGQRNKAIATLGNLTLLNLSVNRSVQHYDFARKQDELIAHTSLRLNVPLISKDGWDEVQIAERSEHLGQLALQVWAKKG
ncbi:DUF262 domain-containing protein [Pseudomonas sp.]|uniref:DUF262 domain-containing protein n=1 Tax=Pseudomonas sp. TaxID=306 RepID=UPI0028AAAE45|nr:DUF262 domain-containing protein [Pseudomonas sp.]